MPVTSRQRMIVGLERRPTDRKPVLPCLWLNHIARAAGLDYGWLLAHPDRPGVKIYQHCCDNYNPILEIAAEEGVDALHGLDPTEGMDLADVKRRVGDKVCFWGGVSTLTLLQGTLQDVVSESKRAMACDEGYILDAACAIPPQSPFENVHAMCAPRPVAGFEDGRAESDVQRPQTRTVRRDHEVGF